MDTIMPGNWLVFFFLGGVLSIASPAAPYIRGEIKRVACFRLPQPRGQPRPKLALTYPVDIDISPYVLDTWARQAQAFVGLDMKRPHIERRMDRGDDDTAPDWGGLMLTLSGGEG
jgi:hypothetical protein